jgi:peptidoglycan/xylan/chitin deacetylase (PgdA/CDA1 family)
MKKSLIFVLMILSLFFIVLLVFYYASFFMQINDNSCLSLTFDDGLKSHRSVVYSLLKEKKFGATFFISSNISGRDYGGYMNESDVNDLVDAGL